MGSADHAAAMGMLFAAGGMLSPSRKNLPACAARNPNDDPRMNSILFR